MVDLSIAMLVHQRVNLVDLTLQQGDLVDFFCDFIMKDVTLSENVGLIFPMIASHFS